ncbi:MAG: tripartite tricarboxylate transporter TctB family protein [Roseovarius sp.]
MTGTYRPNGQALFALVLLVLTSVYASQIFKLGMPFENGVEPGASFLPIVLSGIMYVGALRILIGELRRGRAAAAPAVRSDTVPAVTVLGPLIVIAATAIFAYGLERVGYFTAAGCYTFAVALYFNYEDSGRPLHALILSAVTALAVTLFGWAFFVWLFELTLPVWNL